jgi:hypothetical protein
VAGVGCWGCHARFTSPLAQPVAAGLVVGGGDAGALVDGAVSPVRTAGAVGVAAVAGPAAVGWWPAVQPPAARAAAVSVAYNRVRTVRDTRAPPPSPLMVAVVDKWWVSGWSRVRPGWAGSSRLGHRPVPGGRPCLRHLADYPAPPGHGLPSAGWPGGYVIGHRHELLGELPLVRLLYLTLSFG